jgi:hypothetical protein
MVVFFNAVLVLSRFVKNEGSIEIAIKILLQPLFPHNVIRQISKPLHTEYNPNYPIHWLIRQKFNRAEVFFEMSWLSSRKGLKNNALAEFDTKFTKSSPSRTKRRQAVESKESSRIDEMCLIDMYVRNPLSEEIVVFNESCKPR